MRLEIFVLFNGVVSGSVVEFVEGPEGRMQTFSRETCSQTRTRKRFVRPSELTGISHRDRFEKRVSAHCMHEKIVAAR